MLVAVSARGFVVFARSTSWDGVKVLRHAFIMLNIANSGSRLSRLHFKYGYLWSGMLVTPVIG